MDSLTPVSSAKAPLKVIVSLCAIVGGLSLAEEISNNVLPLTLREFTSDAKLISYILAIHPLFGFIAQPVVGILGDRIWTRVGRRAFFLVLCAPLAAVCLLAMPYMPSLWQLVTVVVFFQLFLAMLWGSDHPLITDLVPTTQRTWVKGCMMVTTEVCSYFFLKWGIGWATARFGEASIYQIAAAGQIVLIAVAALFLNETPAPPVERPKLTVRRYVGDLLGDPVLRRFAILGYVYAAFVYVVVTFAALFAVHTAGITKAQFGDVWSARACAAFACAIPVGFLIRRLPKQWVLVTGFLVALAGCGFGCFASKPGDFYPVAVLFGLGYMVIEVTLKPFFSEYLPRDIVGQLTGAYNICFALGRVTATVGVGWIVSMSDNNYRVIWIAALIFGAASVIVAAGIPDLRFSARRSAARAAALPPLTPLPGPAE